MHSQQYHPASQSIFVLLNVVIENPLFNSVVRHVWYCLAYSCKTKLIYLQYTKVLAMEAGPAVSRVAS